MTSSCLFVKLHIAIYLTFPVGKSPGVTAEAMGVCPTLRAKLLLFFYADELERLLYQRKTTL